MRQEQVRKREDLLCTTEEILETIASVVRSPRSRLRGRQAINRRVGRDVSRKKVTNTPTPNQVTLQGAPDHPFPMSAKPTLLQKKAFDLLRVNPTRFVASNLAG